MPKDRFHGRLEFCTLRLAIPGGPLGAPHRRMAHAEDDRRSLSHRPWCVYASASKTLEVIQSFSLIDCIAVGVDRTKRNFEPMRKQVETSQ